MEHADQLDARGGRAENLSDRRQAWENSYANRDNFIFYPHEEVVRFVSRYIRKRVGLSEFRNLHSLHQVPRLLDLGCGIGSQVLFGHAMGLEAYGVDLSHTALSVAYERATQSGLPADRLRQADVRHLPWPKGFFDYVVSSAVLDSMSFEIARAAITEIARVLAPHGLFYCDLLSANDNHPSNFNGEEIVNDALETDTVQSYFDLPKIKRLIEGHFVIRDASIICKTNLYATGSETRYHIVMEKTQAIEIPSLA